MPGQADLVGCLIETLADRLEYLRGVRLQNSTP